MKIKGKVLSFVLTLALAFTCVAHLFCGVANGNPMTKNTYSFSAFAGEDVDLTTGIGATKYMVSTDGENVLLATAFNVDVANYKEVGYLVTKTGDVDATKHSCGANFYTGITVRTGETTTKDWAMADIFGETNAIGMIVAELAYADANAYSFVPYMVTVDDVTETGAGKTVAAKYDLTLENATVAKVNGEVYTGNATRFAEGTQITVKANQAPDGQMFVRFDADGKTDNLVGEAGNDEYTFTMGAKATSLRAVYADANTSFLTTGTWRSGSSYNPEGMSAVAITESTDADLQGLQGWSFTIPDNAAATTSTTNNLTSVSYTAWGVDQEKIVKLVLKNHGEYDVTVEFAAEYFGFMVCTGNITVPANSVVEEYMIYGPFSGASSTCDWFIHVRENMAGDGNGTVQLDVVAGGAKLYTNKVSSLITEGEGFADYGESNESDNQADVAAASSSGMNLRYWDEYGAMYFYGNNNTSADTYARERLNAVAGNEVHLQNGKKITFYVKATNLFWKDANSKYTLRFTRGSSELSVSILLDVPLTFTGYGQTLIFKVEIDPTKAGSSDNLQFGLMKAKAEGTGGKVNVLIQIAATNIFE